MITTTLYTNTTILCDARNIVVTQDNLIRNVDSYTYGDTTIDENFIFVYRWVIYSIVCNLIDIFGAVTNIVNIACFRQQGFQDTVTISLLGLSISDLCSLVTLIITNVCYNPAFDNLDLSVEPVELQYLAGAWPHIVFTRITSWITAFITLERCLCITLPLKVKTMITPARVKFIIVCIFILLIASVSPVYCVNRLHSKFSLYRNRTIFGLVYTNDHDHVEAVNYAINNVFIQLGAFVAVIICTVTLVVTLKRKANWRRKSTSVEQVESFTDRDKRVIKMVVVISVFFIACFTPLCMIIIAMLVEPQLSLYGRYRNALIIVSGLGFLMESTNSSVNVFIYYYMSSKYKSTFRYLFLNKKSVT